MEKLLPTAVLCPESALGPCKTQSQRTDENQVILKQAAMGEAVSPLRAQHVILFLLRLSLAT